MALLIVAVLVAPLLIDWNAFKPRLAAAVEEATGRQLEIDGDLRLSLLPSPTLSAEGARLANIEGGSQQPMISLEALEVHVALAPLVGGDLRVKSIALVEPAILLERLADGRVNWQLGPPPEEGGQVSAAAPAEEAPGAADVEPGADSRAAGGEPLSVGLERLTIENGTVIYRDALGGTEERVEALNATVSADSLRGPFLLQGDARLRDAPARFSVSVGRLAFAGATPAMLSLALAETGAAEARFNGTLTLGEQSGVAGDLMVRGEDLLVLLEAAAPGAELPGSLAQPYALSARLSYEAGRLALTAIDFSMADSALGGEASLQLAGSSGEPATLQAALKVSRLDLDSLLSDGGGGGQDPAPAANAAEGFGLPADLRGQLDLEIDTLVYRKQVVRQILVNADLQEGRLALNQALALLPGGGNLVLSGELTSEVGTPRFVGRLEAAADNLRALLDWLGIDVEGVPSDRLRRSSLLADIDATPQQASITGLDLEIDTSRLTGGVAVALRERLGLGIGLSVDRINVDAYLPATEAEAAKAPEPVEPRSEQQSETQSGPEPESEPKSEPESGPSESAVAGGDRPRDPAAADAEPGVAGLLGSLDANLDLKVGQITYNGQSAREVTLEGTLQEGRLTLRRLIVGDLAGGAFSLSGVFTGLPAAPAVEDGSFDISVPETGRVGRLLGQPPGGLFERLGSFRASGSASGSARGFTYNADIRALGGAIFSSGQVSGLPDGLRIDDGRIEGSELRGAALARLAGLAADSRIAGIDSLGLTSQFDYAAAGARYDTRLHLLGAEFVAEGTATDFASGLPRFDFRFAAIHQDLAAFLRRLLDESPLAPGAGKLDLRAQVSGSPLKFQLAEITGDIGPTIEGGTFAVDLARARPLVTADLKTREIDLDRLLGDGGGGGQDPAPRWSRQPLELQALGSLDAEFALEAAGLRGGELALVPARLHGNLLDGRLVLDQLDGGFFEGRLSAHGELDTAAATPAASLALKLGGVDAGALLHALGSERVAGRLDLEAKLTTEGNSEAALITALDGQAELGGELTVQARAQEQLGNVVLGILGQQVKELRGVTNPLNELFTAFADRPASLSGTVRLERGVASTRDLQLAGNGARLQARGTLADLPAWTMGLTAALYREDAVDPELEVELNGALDEPNVRLKGAALQIAPGGDAPASGDPATRKPPKPADVLRGLIQGLGKGG